MQATKALWIGIRRTAVLLRNIALSKKSHHSKYAGLLVLSVTLQHPMVKVYSCATAPSVRREATPLLLSVVPWRQFDVAHAKGCAFDALLMGRPLVLISHRRLSLRSRYRQQYQDDTRGKGLCVSVLSVLDSLDALYGFFGQRDGSISSDVLSLRQLKCTRASKLIS